MTPAGERLDKFLTSAISEFKKKSSVMALADLKHLAAKNRDRIERIVAQAAALDKHGDDLESTSNQVMAKHKAILVGLETEMKQIEEFNSDMTAQLGNSSSTEQK